MRQGSCSWGTPSRCCLHTFVFGVHESTIRGAWWFGFTIPLLGMLHAEGEKIIIKWFLAAVSMVLRKYYKHNNNSQDAALNPRRMLGTWKRRKLNPGYSLGVSALSSFSHCTWTQLIIFISCKVIYGMRRRLLWNHGILWIGLNLTEIGGCNTCPSFRVTVRSH